ncbi:1,4-alpha-glucan branching protein GlgB [Arsenicicoccus piscis]|uniref:1,4-alpha-glucan branching enzyme GlgB n=1 Tax=Arsenicicoccus piscis TaxID=673954 RepID=A0ABQ6HPE3_9MICO|nr:1,4-alpha-glucan branching protein GlgB [Arsenicicoccus piscis]MCH8628748.1 1,4-alpha-glucan branching protein GlgB [Arsenicicoccus piscis]GMA20217.1 hypothetical protein GCM10025862_22380 [Arsenicicoccus piscis]
MAKPSVIEDATLTPSKIDLISEWLPAQRWYLGKGHTPSLVRVGSYRFADADDVVGIETHLFADTAAEPSVLYQIPVTYRGTPLAGAERALIGTMEHSTLGTRYVYDGPHDPAYTAELLRTIVEEDVHSEPTRGVVDTHVFGRPASGASRVRDFVVMSSKVLSGEQSNTSIIFDTQDPDGVSKPLIIKVFRALHPGWNPDVTVQTALAEAGSTLVPRPVGALEGTWTSDSVPMTGHLAFAQEFFPGTQDAWRVALAAIDTDHDFSDRSRALGEATGEVHRTLAQVLPTATATSVDRSALADSMRRRYEQAATEVPALREQEAEIAAILDEVVAAPWPVLQRIHGDYHLGQVLDVPGRGWVLLDFEGEPLRPLVERNAPDLALRDVAGMLRSFDYAAGQHEQTHPGSSAAHWATACREAFLDGYTSATGADPRTEPAVLRALELDKALYEVVYEARNRPSWISIPTNAIERLVNSPKEDATVTKDKTPPVAEASTTPAPTTTPRSAAPIPVHTDQINRLVHGHHHNPHEVLGPRVADGSVTVRTFKPRAKSVTLQTEAGETPFTHEHEGVWVAVVPGTEVPDYRVLVDWGDGFVHTIDDPYRFLPTLGEIDLHLISEGRHEQLWTVLGSHVIEYDGPLGKTRGTAFAVWAPNAEAIRVAGDFNAWDSQSHPMRSMGISGVWELFVPGVEAGARYKYEILGHDGQWRAKADPLARATEIPPATASVVDVSSYEWRDADWVARREQSQPHQEPMSIYEVHLGSWRMGLSYTELADQLVNYVKDLGFTHVEFMPVAEHPYAPSWGYQVTGYYAPTSRFGSPDEFRYLVDELHKAGIGVLVDWVPAHFPKDAFALARFDGQALYEHPDPRRGDQPDWGTHVFDFGRPQVRNFLVANALYWFEEFHIDGLRVDAVASMLYLDYSRKDGEWTPNQFGGREHLEAVQFLQETNATVYKKHPGVLMIAEESTSWPGVTRPTHLGGLGFGFKWNMGWMHDTLAYVEHEPIHKQYHHHEMTFSLVYAWSENFVLPISHDEVVYGKGSLLRKMPGDRWQQLANLRAYLGFMWSHPGKQLLFMGQEFAQEAEWADAQSLDWWLLDQPWHLDVHQMLKSMNHLYASRPALWQLDTSPEGFAWIDANDAQGNTFSFLRYGKAPETRAVATSAGTSGTETSVTDPALHGEAQQDERPVVAVVSNFSGGPHYQYRIGLPRPGVWNEILNTDAEAWNGSGVGNMGRIVAEEIPWHGLPYSAEIVVPPLATVWFEPEGSVAADTDETETSATTTSATTGSATPDQR